MQRYSAAADARVVDENVEPAKCFRTDAATDSTERRSATSHSMTVPCPPWLWIADEVASRAPRVRPHKTAWAPNWARVVAMAAPMPRPAPVTTATCPAKAEFDASFIQIAPLG